MRTTRDLMILNISSDFIIRQNLTVRIEQELLRKKLVLVAERSTSISILLADELERLVTQEETYAQTRNAALTNIEQG